MATVVSKDGRFEWDDEKSLLNKIKHGFLFEEILSVFDDPAFLTNYDVEHSETEDRYYGVGNLNGLTLVLVFFTERKNRTRIISARLAEKELTEAYNEYFKHFNA